MPTNLLAEAGFEIPQLTVAGATGFFVKAFGIILLAGFLGALVIYIYWRSRFNKKIVLFKEIGGKYQLAGQDMGQFQRVGTAGDYWLRTKKFKKTLPRPTIQMGVEKSILGLRPIYWYAEREDGEWINFSLQNLDKQMKEAGAHYVDEDMRLQRLGIQRNLQQRFNKETWWQKYGQNIIMVAYFVIVMVCLIVLFREITGVVEKLDGLIGAIEHLATSLANMGARTGSGTVPA